MNNNKLQIRLFVALICLLLICMTACVTANIDIRYSFDKNTNEDTNEEANIPDHDSSEDLLLLVDFQNVYLPGQAWACPTMEQSIENTLKIITFPGSPDYILTKFIAPQNPVGTWEKYNMEYADINTNEYLCDFQESIKQIATDDNVIVKDTYSSMNSEELLSRLDGKKRIVLTGVVAEYCVLSTMMDAIDQGYEVYYLYDCISGNTAENEKMIRTLAESFSPMHTQVMSSKQYLQSISNEDVI